MLAHIYRVGESDQDGIHQECNRVTRFRDNTRYDEEVLILGVSPNITVIPMREVRWYWIEEA